MTQRTPSLQEVLVSYYEYLTSDMYTSIPGVVISVVDGSPTTVNVQPSINIRSDDGLDISERPAILNVPLQQPISLEGGLSFPVRSGDPVMLLFSMRGLDVWKTGNGYPGTPSDMRKFDVRDCIAIPGVFPPSVSSVRPAARTLPHNPQDVVLVHNIGTGNEVEIRLKAGGGVEVNAPRQSVVVNSETATVNASDQVTLDTPETILTGNLTVQGTMSIDGDEGSGTNVIRGNFNIIGSVLDHNGKNIGSTHTHTGVQSGGGTSGPPT